MSKILVRARAGWGKDYQKLRGVRVTSTPNAWLVSLGIGDIYPDHPARCTVALHAAEAREVAEALLAAADVAEGNEVEA